MASPTECTTPFPALLVHNVWLYSSGPVGFVLRLPVFLGFCTQLHMLRWIRGQSIQVLATIPQWKKRVSPQVRSKERVVLPPWLLWRLRLTWKTQFSDVTPKEEDVGGAWFISVGAWRAWIALADLGQLKLSLLPKNLPSSYKFNFCLQWRLDKSKKKKKKQEKEKEKRKLKCPCLHAFLLCHTPKLPPPFTTQVS